MYRCPKCQKEYDEKIEGCKDCGSIIEEIEEEEVIAQDESAAYDKEILLTSAADEIQACMIEELLSSNSIPVLKKRKEAGSYLNIYMGMNSYGIDLYVPSKRYDTAKELLNEIAQENGILEPDEEMEAEKRLYYRKRLIKVWIIILLFMPGVLWIIIALVQQMISYFE